MGGEVIWAMVKRKRVFYWCLLTFTSLSIFVLSACLSELTNFNYIYQIIFNETCCPLLGLTIPDMQRGNELCADQILLPANITSRTRVSGKCGVLPGQYLEISAVDNDNGQQWITMDNNGQQWITMDNINICGASCIFHAVFRCKNISSTYPGEKVANPHFQISRLWCFVATLCCWFAFIGLHSIFNYFRSHLTWFKQTYSTFVQN